MKKKQNTGYCNCKSDKLHYGKKTTTVEVVRDTYHKVRIDCRDLCFLCGNTALCSVPEKSVNKNRLEHVRQFFPDITVSIDNPNGIFLDRKDESMYNNPSCDRIKYRSNGRAELNKNFNSRKNV